MNLDEFEKIEGIDEEEEEDNRKIAEARNLIKMKNTPAVVNNMKKTIFVIILAFITYEYLEYDYITASFSMLKEDFNSAVIINKRNLRILNVKLFARSCESSSK